MYTAVYIHFGKNFGESVPSVKFETKTFTDFRTLNLFNYRASEKDLGRVMYERWYGYQDVNCGRYMVIVKQGDEAQGKRILKESALETLRQRIAEDAAVESLLEAQKIDGEPRALPYSLFQKSESELLAFIESLWQKALKNNDNPNFDDIVCSIFEEIEPWLEHQQNYGAAGEKLAKLISGAPIEDEAKRQDLLNWVDSHF